MISLADLVVDASIILTVTFVVLRALRRRSAALRHWVLATALVLGAVAPFTSLALPSWSPPFAVELPDAGSLVGLPAAGSTALTTPKPSTTAVAADEAAVASDVRRLSDWAALWLWALGGLVMLITLAGGLLRLAWITRQAQPLARQEWNDALAQVRAEYALARPVRLRATAYPGLLLVWGWRRPTLLVPAAADAWPRDRIVAVLRHELAHIARGDWTAQLAAELVRAVHWFNPLVWLACSRLHIEGELACDDAVLAAGLGGPEYASHLLDVARDLRRPARWAPAPAIVRVSTLERRVRAMLDGNVDRRPLSRRGRHAWLVALVALSLAVGTVAAARQFASLSGTLVDSSQAVLPGATMVLVNQDTGAKYEITTDRNGKYEFVGLPAGTYQLESQLPGFAAFRGTVTITGQNVIRDVQLSIGEIVETINVTEGPELAAPRDPERDRRLQEVKEKRAATKCGPAPPPGVPRIGGNIRVPLKYVDRKPRFPEALAGTDGTVLLRGRIGVDGRMEDLTVVSATHPAFADSAIEAVRQWEFDATLLNCERIETPIRINVAFHAQP